MGKVIDARTLPYGTVFRVLNGGWKGQIVVVNGAKGVYIKETDSKFQLKGNEQWDIEILDTWPEFKGSKKLTEPLRDALYLLLDGGCTDSDLEDFCEENKIPQRVVFHTVAILNAPACCKKCKNVDLYASMYPCLSCRRAHPIDYFEEDK